jgi:hypothetical protein
MVPWIAAIDGSGKHSGDLARWCTQEDNPSRTSGHGSYYAIERRRTPKGRTGLSRMWLIVDRHAVVCASFLFHDPSDKDSGFMVVTVEMQAL